MTHIRGPQGATPTAAFFEKLASGVPGVLFTYCQGPDGRRWYPFISSRVQELFGLEPAELSRDAGRVFSILHPDDAPGVVESITASARDLAPWHFQGRLRLTSGEYHWFEAHSMPERQADGGTLWYGQFVDIQAHKDLELSLRASEQEFSYQARFQRLLADLSSSFMGGAFGDIDEDIRELLARVGEFFDVDRAYLYLFSDEARVMTNTHEWCRPGVESLIDGQQQIPITQYSWWHEQMVLMIREQRVLFIDDVAELPEAAAEERRMLEAQGVVSLFNVPVRTRGEVSGFFGMDVLQPRQWRTDQADLLIVVTGLLSEALERHRLEQELLSQSIRDPLTGLHNRRYLIPRLEEMAGRWQREQVPFGVAMFDLDHFKRINDTFGHQAGDYVLREFTALMLEHCRASDVVARYGGEEFVIVAADAGPEAASALVCRVVDRVRQHRFVFAGQALEVTVSAGLAHISDPDLPGVQPETLLGLADRRLYQAKRSGRDRVIDKAGPSNG